MDAFQLRERVIECFILQAALDDLGLDHHLAPLRFHGNEGADHLHVFGPDFALRLLLLAFFLGQNRDFSDLVFDAEDCEVLGQLCVNVGLCKGLLLTTTAGPPGGGYLEFFRAPRPIVS
jgi:hypothetical protein